MTNWEKVKIKDLIDYKTKEVDNLPDGVSISTMCCSAKLGTIIDINNIQEYLQLNENDILTVKLNDSKIRTLIEKKTKNKRKKVVEKKSKTQKFYNQITVVVRIGHGKCDDINKEKTINMKLFKNGSIQMSGCKRIEDVNKVINKLAHKLQEKKGIKFEDSIKQIKFVSDKINVNDFKIDMINSNYQVNLQIDRSNLYKLLLKKKIQCSYEKCIRACVIIKFCPPVDNINEKEISIFVFQKGNIIITGAKSRNQVYASYNFLNKIILDHVDEIMKKDDKEEEEDILNLYNMIIDENCHKLDMFIKKI